SRGVWGGWANIPLSSLGPARGPSPPAPLPLAGEGSNEAPLPLAGEGLGWGHFPAPLLRGLDRFRRFALALLARPHFGIEASSSKQSRMGAALGDLSLVEDDDLIGIDDRRETVGDHDRRPPRGDGAERFLDRRFGSAVERAGGFVE